MDTGGHRWTQTLGTTSALTTCGVIWESTVTCHRTVRGSKWTTPLLTLGTFTTVVSLQGGDSSQDKSVDFVVTKVPQLNLLGRSATVRLNVNTPALLGLPAEKQEGPISVRPIFDDLRPDPTLQDTCRQLCQEFPELFKPELRCLMYFQLEVKFKPETKPIFCKPWVVPFAIQEDLYQVYDAGIARGVWLPTQFNNYGTPVVPIHKPSLPGQLTKLRVCGDYSVTVNQQLEPHRHPMPLPEDLMRKLGGGYGFSRIDLADAYIQIMLAPESQKRLALSTHRGVLLQMRLPFDITSAPGHFQEIMDQLTSDLQGVAVCIDDILVSGATASEHLKNLRSLLIQTPGDERSSLPSGKMHLCSAFGRVPWSYPFSTGIAKGPKVDAVKRMPPPESVSGLRSFLGSVQFYGK